MSRITTVNPRKLVRNYQPKEPPLSRAVRFEGFNIRWTDKQRKYLIENYSDCESEKIADILNCDVREVAAEARRLHITKSSKFILWWQEHRLNISHPTAEAPQGYHWETDSEMQTRLLREREEDSCRAAAIADTFGFCTKSEKQCITSVLYQALRWHRSTSPKIIGNEL